MVLVLLFLRLVFSAAVGYCSCLLTAVAVADVCCCSRLSQRLQGWLDSRLYAQIRETCSTRGSPQGTRTKGILAVTHHPTLGPPSGLPGSL
jgi:hypothetical protein